MRVATALLILISLANAVESAADCHFTAAARLEATDTPGLRTATVERTWRSMTDEYWVSYHASATYPQFSKSLITAAAQLNTIIRRHVEDRLDDECPADARLPDRRTKLVDASSSIEVLCESTYASTRFVSIRCSTDAMILYSAHPSTVIETLLFAIDGQEVRRLVVDDLFLTGAARERLLNMIVDRIRQQQETHGDTGLPAQQDEIALGDAVFRDGFVELEYFPSRWTYESVRFPIADVAFAFTTDLRSRLVKQTVK